jgi:putative addiction module component (TIGR02574 family)
MMNETLSQPGIDRLNISERLELIGLIWYSIIDEEARVIPDWHLGELERRRAAAEADPGAGIPLGEMKARLMGRPWACP